MNNFIFKYLGVFFLLIIFFCFFNIIYSYYFDNLTYLNNYVATFFINLILGIFLTFVKKYKFIKINLYERIFAVLAGYFLLPITISLPYNDIPALDNLGHQRAILPWLFRTRTMLVFVAQGKCP